MKPEIKTIPDLEKWLKDHGYALDHYSINGKVIHEGYGLEQNGNLWQWYYTERGERQTLQHFISEKDAVRFALQVITADPLAKGITGAPENP
ncbi:hypothetical protein OZ410_09155 [Robiginitalea sp. M366]|uniref:hypothetical protein n=1 Tax=Robiginitalea aestuariiviva TaxID=3036903 RepID=UPI00240DDEE3|nr:hypothetical protein [Robiginitalea aestuariiviva]MDG1572482.1 hypothetical protein [Robiginitalea aestuariiviva]